MKEWKPNQIKESGATKQKGRTPAALGEKDIVHHLHQNGNKNWALLTTELENKDREMAPKTWD